MKLGKQQSVVRTKVGTAKQLMPASACKHTLAGRGADRPHLQQSKRNQHLYAEVKQS